MKGFIVIEVCDDYEQILALEVEDNLPDGGVLVWAEGNLKRTVFSERKDARSAIERTYHYAKAFNRTDLPIKAYCKIEPVVSA